MWCLLEHIFLMLSSSPLLVSTLWKVGERCSGWQQASASLGVSSTAYLAAQRCSRGPWQRRRERRPSRRGSGRPPRKGLTCAVQIGFFCFLTNVAQLERHSYPCCKGVSKVKLSLDHNELSRNSFITMYWWKYICALKRFILRGVLFSFKIVPRPDYFLRITVKPEAFFFSFNWGMLCSPGKAAITLVVAMYSWI